MASKIKYIVPLPYSQARELGVPHRNYRGTHRNPGKMDKRAARFVQRAARLGVTIDTPKGEVAAMGMIVPNGGRTRFVTGFGFTNRAHATKAAREVGTEVISL